MYMYIGVDNTCTCTGKITPSNQVNDQCTYILLDNTRVEILYSTVLHCTVLYCTVLHCTVLYCTVLYCTALYCIILIEICS